ncbi:MAG: ABC transporter ATP-binding protein [Dehalococcoidia bacterium]|nr:ABC transporter ATP-binding protein [Dehalococcoidia bacterium]
MSIIRARGLTKRFGDLVAVAGIDFDIQEGECFGFLGPNGAGKTSTIRMIYGASPVTAGEVWVNGKDVRRCPREIKAAVGVVPQENNLDPDLSVIQNLLVYARYFSIPGAIARDRAREVLELLQLWDRRDSHTESLSSGMKRRLVIARGLINQPKVLILDEPTTGLDPQARHMVWQKLRQLKAQGVTLILTTHYMEEASHLCDRLAILDKGSVLVTGTPSEVISQYVGEEVLELAPRPEGREAIVSWLEQHGLETELVEDMIYVFGRDSSGLPQPPGVFDKVVRRRATLEDVFLRLTGRALRE